jgi:hypothetical protein
MDKLKKHPKLMTSQSICNSKLERAGVAKITLAYSLRGQFKVKRQLPARQAIA